MKVLIVGGVAGGASVAARVRRIDENSQIIMFERGPHVSFSNCSLPYHLSGMIEDSEKLVLMNPHSFQVKYNIEARVNQEVIAIDPHNKTVKVKNLLTGETYQESYDKLALAPGAAAVLPQVIKGINSENVFVVKNVVDIERLQNYIVDNAVTDVAVVGGGFIGLEVCENLVEAGKKVHLIEALDQVMAPLDFDMAQLLHKELDDHGVDLLLKQRVVEIKKDTVLLESGDAVKAQVVVMAAGVRPETKLAEQCGIELGQTGAILVNHNYQTNYPDIYAVGDAIEVTHRITGQKTKLALAGPAQRQARAAADHMFGRLHSNRGVIGSSCIHLFNLNVASTGLNEKQCQQHGFNYDYVYTIPGDKVGLMPDANPMHFKLIYQVPTGKILGAQAIGKGNVDKRIDVMATMIYMNGTLEDLKELELCYSPQYSTAKDVVNNAALVALNILNNDFKQVKVSEVRGLVESGAQIIDVREKSEYQNGHIIGAKNIPMSEFRTRLDEFPKDQPIYLHCRSSQRSYNVVRALQTLGFDNVYNISGSFLGVCLNQYFIDKTTGRDKIVTEYNFN
ncbi:MAG: pyridine nucleotide-disulfide oxidoreductase [Clostridiales bacterium]|nr:MAG: pyridine nucleotide-disulfide oxidoreductase [Clostridiales bacterium]